MPFKTIAAVTLASFGAAGLATTASAGVITLGQHADTNAKPGIVLAATKEERRRARRANRKADKRAKRNRNRDIVVKRTVVKKPVVVVRERRPRRAFGVTINFGKKKSRVIVRRGLGPRYLPRRPRRVATPGIDNRIGNQARRIRNGVRRGALTRGQARRLRNRLSQIRTARNFARTDGRVTGAERRRLHTMLDRLGSRIRNAKAGGRRFL
ncbi:MAG: hypothetical protein AAFV26_09145 [Pseudomonadota bacterium]